MTANESTSEGKLTGRQEQTIVALLSHRSIREAATNCKVSESTLLRWMAQPVFRSRYEAERRQLFEGAKTALRRGALGAVQTLLQVQADPEAPPNSRVAAARAVLDLCMRIQEGDDILERLDRLEEANHGNRS